MNLDRHVLLVIDVQKSFDDPAWGPRNNPACDENIALLLAEWRARGRRVVFVRHDSVIPEGRLKPGTIGNDFKSYITGDPDLLVTKNVNSAFLGQPDLDPWLRANGATGIVICGMTTNHCCETTARMGGNLGWDVLFVLDATHAFDRTGPDGTVFTADQIAAMTAANLHGEFATVVSTRDVLSA